jgi:RNA 3'-terminal phosphate cyclase (ATP)
MCGPLHVKRHGYYPRGGGIVLAQAWPGHPRPLVLATRGALLGIRGQAHVANLPRHVVERMRDAAYAQLPAQSQPTIDTAVLSREQAEGRGGAIVLWASFEGTVLGAGRVAELGVRAETLGEAAAAELAADLHSGATADVHAADQLLVYFALAGGGALLTRTVSPHALTMIWLIEQFLPVRFSSRQRDGLVLVTVEPR